MTSVTVSALRGAHDDAVRFIHRLYVDHAQVVRRTLLRLGVADASVDDLLQDVFVVAYRRISTFDPSREPRPWLLGIAVKLATAQRRHQRLRQFLGVDAASNVPAEHEPDQVLQQREAARRLQELLRSISSKKREVVVLSDLEGLTGEEISTALNIPVKTVWTRLARGRAELARAARRARLFGRGQP